jgi:RNA polymerase sigma factor (TIGR02999 family)
VPSRDLTATLSDLATGDQGLRDELLEAVYEELRELAEAKLEREPPGHTLQPTALVHEAYLRLIDQTRVNWQGRTHFIAVATIAMRRVLIDHARRRGREKRGGKWRRVALDDAFALTTDSQLDLVELDEALASMRRLDERQADIVELRLLGGLTGKETAVALDVSARTVDRDWRIGLAWLRRELGREE